MRERRRWRQGKKERERDERSDKGEEKEGRKVG